MWSLVWVCIGLNCFTFCRKHAGARNSSLIYTHTDNLSLSLPIGNGNIDNRPTSTQSRTLLSLYCLSLPNRSLLSTMVFRLNSRIEPVAATIEANNAQMNKAIIEWRNESTCTKRRTQTYTGLDNCRYGCDDVADAFFKMPSCASCCW